MNKKIAVITGASSGMGKEFAVQIDKRFRNIDEIWLIARRADLLEEVRCEINTPCILIDEDITTPEFVTRYKKMIAQENPNVRMLINCAGYGVYGKAEEQSRELELGMIETNCIGLTNLIFLTLPYMRRHARIINLASAAAFLPQPDFAVYAATKSYVLSFSRSMKHELRKREIFVTAVCPGPVNTDFFRLAEGGKQRAWYKEYFMSRKEEVVNLALKDAIAKKEISVYSKSMKALLIAGKILPHGLLLKCMDVINR